MLLNRHHELVLPVTLTDIEGMLHVTLKANHYGGPLLNIVLVQYSLEIIFAMMYYTPRIACKISSKRKRSGDIYHASVVDANKAVQRLQNFPVIYVEK